MKKQIFSFLALVAIVISASAQSGNNSTAIVTVNKNLSHFMNDPATLSVSTELTKSFEKNYPLAQDAQWVKMDNGYRVSFINESNNTVAVFHENGRFQYAVTDLYFEQLPVVVKQIIQKDYKDSKVFKSVAINNKGNVTHQVILEGASNFTIIKVNGEDVEISSMHNGTAKN